MWWLFNTTAAQVSDNSSSKQKAVQEAFKKNLGNDISILVSEKFQHISMDQKDHMHVCIPRKDSNLSFVGELEAL